MNVRRASPATEEHKGWEPLSEKLCTSYLKTYVEENEEGITTLLKFR